MFTTTLSFYVFWCFQRFDASPSLSLPPSHAWIQAKWQSAKRQSAECHRNFSRSQQRLMTKCNKATYSLSWTFFWGQTPRCWWGSLAIRIFNSTMILTSTTCSRSHFGALSGSSSGQGCQELQFELLEVLTECLKNREDTTKHTEFIHACWTGKNRKLTRQRLA